MSTWTYLKSFVTDKNVASVTPSSKFCVEHVCRPLNFSQPLNIVEYGPGTGVYARYLLDRMTTDSRLIMIEMNEQFVEELNKMEDPRATVHQGSVEHVMEFVDEELHGNIDAIISGIPFSFLTTELKKQILRDSKKLLRPGGQFLAYQTSKHLEQPLRAAFGNVSTEWEWRNIPPMTIYQAENRS
jgi:phosphatidylethanolamine/phosphatidyl-N-methylethanolamine N-methyltransferase